MPTVLVTGAAGGIGRTLVQKFLDAGYSVLALDKKSVNVSLPGCTELAVDLQKMVFDDDSVSHAVSQIIRWLDGRPLDVLVNNAAIQIVGGVREATLTDWRCSLDVNLLAPFLLTQQLLKPLEAARGCVVNVSSIHARLTKPGFVMYATTKAALSGLTRAMAVDLGGAVRVFGIEPAAIETPMLVEGISGDETKRRALDACHPIGRIGWPVEVAHLAVTLAGRGFDFLHGECISLDGGVGARLRDPD